MKNPTLEQILNRTETLDYTKIYKYAKQEGILGKPALFSSNENLKTYPLKIKLHHSFCNPQKVIEEIETYAKKRKVINWFQHGKYVGNYLIEKYAVKVIQKIDEAIIMAEVTITLLEKPDITESFKQQTGNIASLLAQKFLSGSVVIKSISKLPTVYNTVLTNIANRTSTALSTSGNQVLTQMKTSIVRDIQSQGLSSANKVVTSYIKTLNTQNM